MGVSVSEANGVLLSSGPSVAGTEGSSSGNLGSTSVFSVPQILVLPLEKSQTRPHHHLFCV